jgi:RNA 3'-terminal phosphate cyclase
MERNGMQSGETIMSDETMQSKVDAVRKQAEAARRQAEAARSAVGGPKQARTILLAVDASEESQDERITVCEGTELSMVLSKLGNEDLIALMHHTNTLSKAVLTQLGQEVKKG